MKPILCTLFALPLVCAPLARAQAGQSTTGTFFQGTGQLRNVVSGNFRGALSRDAVLLQGQALWHLTRPAEIRSMAAIAIPGVTSVTGMVAFQRRENAAVMPPILTGEGCAGLALGEPDVLLVTTTSGTFRGEFSRDAHGFTFTSTLNARWTGATLLTAGRDPLTGTIRIAGRGPDNALLLASRDPAGNLTPRLATVLPSSSSILELVWVDWDHDGDLDCAVTTTAGFMVCTSTGAGLQSAPMAFSAMCSTPAVSGGAAVHASVTDAMTSPSFGRSVSSATSWQVMPLDTFGLTLAQQTPTCLRAFDVGSDGESEYVLMRSGSFRPVYIDALGSLEFDLGNPTNGDPTLNRCPLLFDDLNGDQRPDGLFFFDSPGPLMVFRNSLYRKPAPGGGYTLAPPNFNPQIDLTAVQEVIEEATYYGDQTDNALDGRLELVIDKALAGQATHFDIVVWHQGDPMNEPYLDRIPVHNSRHPIPAGVDKFTVYFQLLPALRDTYFWPDHDHYWLDMRFVDVANNKVVYGETDGLTLFPFHPSEDEGEEQYLYDNTFYYLSHRDPLPGQTVTQIPILYPFVDPPGHSGSHTDIGEIFTRITPPIVKPGYVPL